MPGSVRRHLFFIATACATAFFPAYAQAQTFPPLVSPASHISAPGKIVSAQLVTPDLASTEKFYGALLGWTFQDIPVRHGRVAQILNQGKAIGTIVEHPFTNPDQRPSWLPIVATPDADATARQGSTLGGKTLFRPRDIPGYGRETVLSDPDGAIFLALRATGGDPPDTADPIGNWCWSALLTSDPAKAQDFYGKLFGYQTETLASGHVLISSQGNARGSLNMFPASFPTTATARWIRFVRVAGVGATAEQAASQGGRVVVQPHVDRDGIMVAILADPAGAVFGIMEYPSETPVGEAK